METEGKDREKIHSILNFQLLDMGTNRGKKQGKPLKEWIKHNVDGKKHYTTIHLIPEDETLWDTPMFDGFITRRAGMILAKISEAMVI